MEGNLRDIYLSNTTRTPCLQTRDYDNLVSAKFDQGIETISIRRSDRMTSFQTQLDPLPEATPYGRLA